MVNTMTSGMTRRAIRKRRMKRSKTKTHVTPTKIPTEPSTLFLEAM
jgi:hypothetical protein